MFRSWFAALALASGFVACGAANGDVWYVPSEIGPTRGVSAPVPITPVPVVVAPAPVTYMISRPVVVVEPVYHPVIVEPVYVEPVIVSHRVYAPAPVYHRPLASSPRVTREQLKSRPGRFEYEQKGRIRTYGTRSRSYDYEYEVDYKHGRYKVEFDIDD